MMEGLTEEDENKLEVEAVALDSEDDDELPF